MISMNPDVMVHNDTALAKPGMRRVEKVQKMLDAYYDGHMINLADHTEDIEELIEAYIDLLDKTEKRRLVVILTDVDAFDETKGFYFGMKYEAKDLDNGYYKVYTPDGQSSSFSQKQVRLVKR